MYALGNEPPHDAGAVGRVQRTEGFRQAVMTAAKCRERSVERSLVEQEADARRVMSVLPKRLERYGLTLHPDKTRLVDFRHPMQGGPGRGRSFDYLAFTHHWARSRKGRWVVKRKTAKGRFTRAVKHIGQWCRVHRHRPIREQQAALNRKLRGHDAYYGVTGNISGLRAFYGKVRYIWRKWLGRRGGKARLTAKKYNRMLKTRYPLLEPTVVHSIYRSATGNANR